MKKYFIYSIFLLNIAVTISFWWYFSGSLLTTGLTDSILLSLSRLAGLLATQLALYQLLLIGRVKWVEQTFGLDKLSRVHKWNGYAILALVILHIWLVTKAYAGFNDVPFFAQYSNILINFEDVFKAFLSYLILLGTIVFSITIIKRKLKYEYWYYVHILNYLAYFLFVGHQLELGMSADSLPFNIYWLATYTITALLILYFRFFLPVWRLQKHKFQISKIETLPGATSIYIDGNNLDRFVRKSGQFMILRFLQKGFWWQAHPFSLSWSARNSQLRITIKNLGDFTAKINELQVGTKVLIDGPHGVFTADHIQQEKVLLIAGGIGVTPLRSIAEDLAGHKNVVFLYSAKSIMEAPLLDELKQLTAKPNFRFIPIFSVEQVSGAEHGILDKQKINSLVPDLKERDVFLCGPPTMMTALTGTLHELGLPSKQLHSEKFSL